MSNQMVSPIGANKFSIDNHGQSFQRNDYINIKSNACVSVNSNSVDFNLPGFKPPAKKDYTPNQYDEESAADCAFEEIKNEENGANGFQAFRSRSLTRTVVDSRQQSTIVNKRVPRQMIVGQMSASVKQMQQFSTNVNHNYRIRVNGTTIPFAGYDTNTQSQIVSRQRSDSKTSHFKKKLKEQQEKLKSLEFGGNMQPFNNLENSCKNQRKQIFANDNDQWSNSALSIAKMNPNEILNSMGQRSAVQTPSVGPKSSLVGLRSKKLPALDEEFAIGGGDVRQLPKMSNEYSSGGGQMRQVGLKASMVAVGGGRNQHYSKTTYNH